MDAGNNHILFEHWHAPCNTPSTTQFWEPWYRQAGDSFFYTGLITLTATSPPVLGTLVQAGRGFPLLHRAHHAHSDEPNPFWGPWYRQAGDSLFYTGLITLTATSPTRFGDLGTGRPGIPSFIPPADGSAASSARRPWSRPTRRAAVAPPPGSAATPHPPP